MMINYDEFVVERDANLFLEVYNYIHNPLFVLVELIRCIKDINTHILILPNQHFLNAMIITIGFILENIERQLLLM